MHLDFSTLASRDCYKLLAALIVPRPIALVTSLNQNGVVNAAPFSFFNCMGSDPPLIYITFSARPDTPHAPGEIKDTSLNVARTKEFVVNLVDENMAEAMNICATDFPHDISEIDAAGLKLESSHLIQTPRLAASPASFECREHTRLEIGNNRILIGEVLGLSIRDELLNTQKLYVDTNALHLIGRMGGAGGYTRTREHFEIPRLSFGEWQARNSSKPDSLK
jgi:flavin reductase (DIM6/NTAB) family NADH-FMN oxidoreductase RutF